MSETLTSSVLTGSQIAQLRALFDTTYARHKLNDGKLGLWEPVYTALFNMITDVTTVAGPEGASTTVQPKAGVDPQSWLWLRGARYINPGVGPFAKFIREYTIIQHTLRYGFPPVEEGLNNELNRASNNIAVNFLGQWLGYSLDNFDAPPSGGSVPNIIEAGAYDAGPAAANVFNKEGLPGDPAGWAGTLLFGNLGTKKFWNDLILKSLLNPDQKGQLDYSNPNGGKLLPATRDIGSYNAIAAAASLQAYAAGYGDGPSIFSLAGLTNATEFFDLFIAGQFGSIGLVNQLANDTNAAFKALYGLSGGEDPDVDLGSDTFGFWSTATDFLKDAHYTVGSKGGDTIGYTKAVNGAYLTSTSAVGQVLGNLGINPKGDVVNAGRGDDTVYGTTGSDILDGGEHDAGGGDTLIYLPQDWKGPFSEIAISFDGKGLFDSRIVIDKTSLVRDDRDIAANFEVLKIDFGGKAVADASSPSGYREAGVGGASNLIVTVDLTNPATKIGTALKRDEYVRVTGDLSQADDTYVTLDLGLGDDTVDFTELTAGRKGDNDLAFKNVEHVILSQFSDDFRVTNAPDSTLRDVNAGTGNDYIEINGGQNVTVIGGLGRDRIINLTQGGEIWGDLVNSFIDPKTGKRIQIVGDVTTVIADTAANADSFRFSANTVIMDAQKSDILTYYGLRLTGGDTTATTVAFAAAAFNPVLGAGIAGAAALANAGRVATGASPIYFDRFVPWISYKLVEGEGEGTKDLLVGNVFNALLNILSLNGDGLFDASGDDSYAQNKGARGVMRVVEFDRGAGTFFSAPGDLGIALDDINPAALFAAIAPFIQGIPIAQSQFAGLNALALAATAVYIGAEYARFAKKISWADGGDPLVIDLDGDGIETIGLRDSRAYFDVDGDMFAEKTGWLKGDDGFLVLDENANGRIDDISEMFGNRAQGGYDELAGYDSNGDGKITVADLVWSELKVWQDRDRDGETDAGELKSLSALGITEFSLASTALGATTPQGAHRRDAAANDNQASAWPERTFIFEMVA